MTDSIGPSGNEELYDWFQTNWETIVETKINIDIWSKNINSEPVRIETFGYGADCYGSSSRVFLPDQLATHHIAVNNKYKFDSFGMKHENGWFEIGYPFDFIKVIDENENEKIISIENTTFTLIKNEKKSFVPSGVV